MSEPVFPPSVGTLSRESRMDFDVDAFARLAHDMYDQPSLEKTLEKIVESAVAVLGCDYAGLLMTAKGHQLVATTASDPAAEKADKLQIEVQEGPGIAAVAEARTTVVHDTAADMRWPRWAAGMRDLRLGSVLAVQLWTSQLTLGALTLYAGPPRWFDADALAAAEVLGRHASIALSTARRRGIVAAGHRRTHAHRPGPRHPHGTVCYRRPSRVRGPTSPLPEHQHQAQRSGAHPGQLASPAQILTTVRGGFPARRPVGSAPSR